MEKIKYNLRYDGFTLETIELEPMLQRDRDVVRRQLAKKYLIPSHYLRLCRVNGNHSKGGETHV